MQRARERDIAFVFQLFALYPHMNVRKNIGFPLLAQGMPRAEIRQRVEETARLLRIDHLLDKPVSGLAGGDRQRVALGRAIVRRPKCFLMDEPLGTLDTEFRDLMVHELRELHNRINATTVYVTHDQLEAMSMADKIAVMNHGVIEQFGTPQEIYDRPATMFVADFIGSPPMNFLPFHGGLAEGRARRSSSRAPPSPCRRSARTWRRRDMALGVRPEHIRFDDASELRGAVFGAEYLGTTQIVAVETADGMVKARVPADVAVQHRRARSAWRSTARGCRCSTRRPAGRSAPRSTTEARMADVRLERRQQALRRRSRRSRDLDLHIADGEFVVLLGPTGAGKTTTLRLIAGLEKPEPGTIHIGGRDVTAARAGGARRRLRLPAIFALSASVGLRQPRLSAALAGAPDAARTRSAGASRRWRSWCASTTSSRTARRSCPAARCSASPSAGRWCASPSIYLMDEPLSSLDAKLRAELRLELKRIQPELGATVLYVTHDQIEAMTMADRIGILADGVLVQIGTPRDDLHRARQPACRGAPRPAGDQPAAARPAARRRRAGGHEDDRRAHRASDDRQGGERPCRRRRSTGSSISATRTTCMSRSGTAS